MQTSDLDIYFVQRTTAVDSIPCNLMQKKEEKVKQRKRNGDNRLMSRARGMCNNKDKVRLSQ